MTNSLGTNSPWNNNSIAFATPLPKNQYPDIYRTRNPASPGVNDYYQKKQQAFLFKARNLLPTQPQPYAIYLASTLPNISYAVRKAGRRNNSMRWAGTGYTQYWPPNQ